MALRKIVYEGESLLRKQSKEVKEISARIKTLIEDMWDTVYDQNGVGLAAPQVGVLRRVVVIDTTPPPIDEDDEDYDEDYIEDEDLESGDEEDSAESMKEESEEPPVPQKYTLINPEIVWSSDELICGSEGCLSVPGRIATVERNERVRVKALDEEGVPFEIEADGLLAKALQHEIDHLNGVLITDIASEIEDLRERTEESDD